MKIEAGKRTAGIHFRVLPGNEDVRVTIRNKDVFISAADFLLLRDYSWSVGGNGYAILTPRTGAGAKPIYLHALVAKAVGLDKGNGRVIDHMNRNPLDNRRTNLRCVTHAANLRNVGPSKANKTGVKHVYEKRLKSGIVRYIVSLKTPHGPRLEKHCKTLEQARQVSQELELEREKLYGT